TAQLRVDSCVHTKTSEWGTFRFARDGLPAAAGGSVFAVSLGLLRLHEAMHLPPVGQEHRGPLGRLHDVQHVCLVVGAVGVIPTAALHPGFVHDRVLVVHDGVLFLGGADHKV